MVSHDRDFLQGLTNKVYEFKERKIKEFLGDINEYLKTRNAEDFRVIENSSPSVNKTKKGERRNKDYQEQKKVKSLKNKINKLEKEIAILEKEIADVDHQLLMNYDQTISEDNFFEDYHKKKEALAKLMKSWEEFTTELEKYS